MNFVRPLFGVFALAIYIFAPTFGLRQNLQVLVERNTENIRYILKEVFALRGDIDVVYDVLNKTCAADGKPDNDFEESITDKNAESQKDSIKSELLSKVDQQIKYVLRGVKDAKLAAHESLKYITEDQISAMNRTEHIENNVKGIEAHLQAFQTTTQIQNDQMKSELSHLTETIVNETHATEENFNEFNFSIISLKSRFESFEQNDKTLSSETKIIKDEVKDLKVKATSTEDSINKLQEQMILLLNGWKPFQGSLYLFVEEKYSFRAANVYCEDFNSYLAAVTSPEENTFITAIFPNVWAAWLGGNDKDKEGQWEWTSQEQFLYSNWTSNEPNNAGSGEDCVSTYRHGGWNDYPCDQTINFVCEFRV